MVRRVERGIDVVRSVLPGRIGPVVVEVPASTGDLDETLGVQPGTYAGIAAVTAPVGSAADEDGPVHVFVNPDVTSGLRRAGAQVVMSHELVHVATDAARSDLAPWLLEGFADYVALHDVDLPLSTTAAAASPTIAALRQRRSMCVFATLPPHVVSVMKGSRGSGRPAVPAGRRRGGGDPRGRRRSPARAGAEGAGVEPARLSARPRSRRVPSPIGWPFRSRSEWAVQGSNLRPPARHTGALAC